MGIGITGTAGVKGRQRRGSVADGASWRAGLRSPPSMMKLLNLEMNILTDLSAKRPFGMGVRSCVESFTSSFVREDREVHGNNWTGSCLVVLLDDAFF